MSNISYIFDDNTLTLYQLYSNQPLSERQTNQHNFWLSLSDSQKQFIRDEVLNSGNSIIANVNFQCVSPLDLEKTLSLDKVLCYRVQQDQWADYGE